MKKGIYILNPHSISRIYHAAEQAEIAGMLDIYAPPQSAETVAADPQILSEAQIILSGWGAPCMDEQFLSAVPKLEAVFYAAGSIRNIVTDAFWERGIVITSAASANAVPVAEYTFSQILFSLKRGWSHAMAVREHGRTGWKREPIAGAYGSTVGLISLGLIARITCNMLRQTDINVIAYDPFVGEETAAELGVELCPLDEIFRRADVVSLHSPNLPQTRGMITGEHFAAMKQNATFINTARATIVRENEMIEVLGARRDLWAVLDVTDSGPPVENSPLLKLHNVILTPHIAGSMDSECGRMGKFMADELRRFLNGECLKWRISKENLELMA